MRPNLATAVLISLTVFASLAHAGSESNASAGLADPCPTENQKTRSIAVRFVASPQLAAVRDEIGMGSPDTSAIRVLVTPDDQAICDWLHDNVEPSDGHPPLSRAYYQVNGYYLFVTAIEADGSLRRAPLVVFDSSLTLRKAVGM